MIRLGAYFHIGTYIWPTCRPLCIFSRPKCPNAQMPQNNMKNYFLVVLDHFSCKNGPNDLVRGLFSNLDIWTNILSTHQPLSTIWVNFGLPKCTKTA
jgi:hypothetical protein